MIDAENGLVLLVGILAGWLVWFAFRRLPIRWLLEYGETEPPESLYQIQKIALWPEALLLMLFGGGLALSAWQKIPSLPELIFFALSSFILLIILVADWKTQIIPDPLTFAIIIIAIFQLTRHLLYNQIAPLMVFLQVLAGLAAAGFLLLLGWLGEKLSGQEAMGMGDVKLIAACAWLVGPMQTIPLVFISFLLAALPAFPMLIRKYLVARKAPVSDVLPFGPFIVMAALIVQLFAAELAQLGNFYWGQFQ